MTNLRTRLVSATLGTLVATYATFAPTQSFAVPGYDGSWSVLVMTQKGDCDPAYRYPIRISNGRLINAGDTAFTVVGKIATGVGHLAGAEGTGTWTGGSCSGSWTAERRGLESGPVTPPSW